MIPYYELHSVFREIFRSLNVIQAPKIQIETILRLNGSNEKISTKYGFIFNSYDMGIDTYKVEGFLTRTNEIFCGSDVVTNSFSKYDKATDLVKQYGGSLYVLPFGKMIIADGGSEDMIAHF